MNRKLALAGYLVAVHIVALVGISRTSTFATLAAKAGIDLPAAAQAVEADRKTQLRLDEQAPAGASVFLGDSNTVWLATSTVAPLSVNLAISGQTASQLLAGMDAYRSLQRAARVYLMIGTNDLLRDPNAELGPIYRALLSRIPATVPVTLSSVPPLDGQDVRHAVEAARHSCSTDPRCTFVDTHATLTEGGAIRPGVLSDGVHLTPAGYALWAGALRSAATVGPAKQLAP